MSNSRKYGSAQDEEWIPGPKGSSNRGSKRTQKSKAAAQKNKKQKKEPEFPAGSSEEEEYDDMFLLMKKLEDLKKKKKRQKENKHRDHITTIINQGMKALQDMIKKQKEMDKRKGESEAIQKEKRFAEIHTEFKDWYATFNSLHQAYLTDMAKLNRQYTRQCKRLDALIAGTKNSDIPDTREEERTMQLQISKIMNSMKSKLLAKESKGSSPNVPMNFESL